MKHQMLIAACIVGYSFSAASQASSACGQLAEIKQISQKMYGKDGKSKKNTATAKSQANDCLENEWRYLSKRLTFRGLTPQVAMAVATVENPTGTARYSPAELYSANSATPTALLTRPVVHVNYVPGTSRLVSPIDTTRLHLMDEVPTSNYQGSLATPIVCQTGYWTGRY